MDIITNAELHGNDKPAELSYLLLDTINERIQTGKDEGNSEVIISSTQEVIQKELFDKRNLVYQKLLLAGYTFSTNYDSLMSTSPHLGWDIVPRTYEKVPDKLLVGKTAPTRGSFSYKNYRLWVNIEPTT